MKTSTYSIQIPEPCHESWSAMQVTNAGRHCTSCNKTVIDFSGKTDGEIHALLQAHQGQKVCGHFKSTQLNRPLHLKVDLEKLPGNMSSTRNFALAVFLVFGALLFNCTDMSGQRVTSFQLERSDEPIQGKVRIGVNDTPPDSLPKPEVLVNGGIRFVEDTILKQIPVIEPKEFMGDVMMGEIVERLSEKDSSLIKAIDESVSTTKTLDGNQPEEVIQDSSLLLTPELLLYPNPSNGEAHLSYELKQRADVRADLFDNAGRFLRTLIDVAQQYAGRYTVPFATGTLPEGIYMVTLTHNGQRRTAKLVIQR